MVTAIVRRLASFIPLMVLISLISFVLLDLSPADPARIVAGETATEQQVADTRARLGLDKPLFERYGTFVSHAVHADLGTSFTRQTPVIDSIRPALGVTLSLAIIALMFSFLIGIVLGVASALLRGTWFDRLTRLLSAVALAVPPFVVALALVILFAVNRSWFPATGYVQPSDGLTEWFRSLVLPGLALSVASSAEIIRQVRGSLVDTLEKDFIRGLRAKGLTEGAVVLRHALKNASPIIVTVSGLQATRIIGGAVVIESIFSLPGLGQLALRAVNERDLPMIQGAVLIGGLLIASTNLVADMLATLFNPKVRHQ